MRRNVNYSKFILGAARRLFNNSEPEKKKAVSPVLSYEMIRPLIEALSYANVQIMSQCNWAKD